MLKIKDNIDLKELEKFGFKYYSQYNEYRLSKVEILSVNCKNRAIWISGYFKTFVYLLDDVYELIKADLVEKVVDYES